MKRFRSPIGCAVLWAVTAACTARTARDPRLVGIQAVKDVEAAWVKDAALKDPARMASYYSSVETVLIFPNSLSVMGRDDVQDAWTTMMRDPNFAFSFQSTRAEASKGGDLVYTVGTYSLNRSDPRDKKPITGKGKYMRVFKKQADGTWKAVADSINSDLPVHDSTH